MVVKSLKERIADNEPTLVAEGYLFELERRGYMSAGGFVPEVVLDHPEVLEACHLDFARAGSDVIQAFTYYGHREKLRLINREEDLEPMNRQALRLAKKVADETGNLTSGSICNTTVFDRHDQNKQQIAADIMKEQVVWAEEEGADLMIAETFADFAEAELALQVIKKYTNLTNVVNIAPHALTQTRDGLSYTEALKKLEGQGADVVGLNCSSGPQLITKMLREVQKTCKGPLACLPVTFRTTEEAPAYHSLKLPDGRRAFPLHIDYFYTHRDDFYQFGLDMKEMGVAVAGICCGNSPRHFRSFAEGMGRTPYASKYRPNMDIHYIYGTDPRLHQTNVQELRNILNNPQDKIAPSST